MFTGPFGMMIVIMIGFALFMRGVYVKDNYLVNDWRTKLATFILWLFPLGMFYLGVWHHYLMSN